MSSTTLTGQQSSSVLQSIHWEDRVCNEIKAFMCYTETSNITERYTLIEELKTWTEAQQYCREHHTDLVSIKNASENEDLVKKAQGYSFWIGLFNNPWKWSHQGDNYTFHNWNTGEPNNAGGNENCVEIGVMGNQYLSRGEWNDVNCRLMLPFFCFDEAEPTSLPSTPVSQEAESSSLPSTPVSQEAESSSLPSTLVSQEAEPTSLPSTPVSQDPTPSESLSTPASKDPQDTTIVQSDSQNSPTTGPAASQTPDGGEQSQQPSTMGGTSPRASSPGHSSSWRSGTSPAVTVTLVPEELHLISDSMVWPEAWQYCRDHYTDLVSLTSLAAQNRVSELVRNSTASRFWIGLHRTVVYDNWYWVAGKDKRAPLNYTNWAPGEPNNPYYEHCGEMVLGEDGGAEWNDLCCYEKLPFICFKG
ncbi:macrophage mannose receptor 1-like [Acipenser ruthenus]|uniref:macrophage mannose receptor 1-like n=1 Tax=Acipenser ruthenus TaxID=7906 RepID=UPI0027426CD2|nr:macrophage mannose receptor 1-like [Acipenser ruthenus]